MSNHTLRNSIRSLADLAAQAPSLYKVVGHLGEQRRRQRAGRVARQAGLLGAGLVLGAGLTTLFTPATGAQVRRRLFEKAMRVRHYIAPGIKDAAPGAARKQKELS